ncbi:MAG: hypothetical protein LLG37_03940 [Spirochaetia bacterium]|nr:hypothetical protein [Spirochaetia bacterium]
MKIKVAVFKRNIQDVPAALTTNDMHRWEVYPGDFSYAFPLAEQRAKTMRKLKKLDYGFRKMVFLSAN